MKFFYKPFGKIRKIHRICLSYQQHLKQLFLHFVHVYFQYVTDAYFKLFENQKIETCSSV